MFYVSLQSEINLDKLHLKLKELDIKKWFYIGYDNCWRIQAEAAIITAASRISIADRLDKVIWQLRRPYIEWIGQLSKLNDSSEWWATELASKNPYYAPYLNICLFEVTRQIISEDYNCPILIVCSSPAMLK